MRRKCNSLDGGAEEKVQLRNHKSVRRRKVAIKLDLLPKAENKLLMQKREEKNNQLHLKRKQSHHCCFYSGGVHAGEEGQGTLRDQGEHEFEQGCTVTCRTECEFNKVAHPANRPIKFLTFALMGQ